MTMIVGVSSRLRRGFFRLGALRLGGGPRFRGGHDGPLRVVVDQVLDLIDAPAQRIAARRGRQQADAKKT